ncbi:hypothetical protein ACFE04_001957 [Oxalis oulophora]
MKSQLFLVISFSLSFFICPILACHATDKEALLEFKSKITSDPWKLLGTWNSSTDCCTSWKGVSCDSSGRVVNLTRPGLFDDPDYMIVDTSMTGTISPYLGNLTSLQYLDLSNLKELFGNIPAELGKLNQLIYAFLDTNKFNGWIPTTFQHLTKLQKLYLSNNQLTGTIPAELIGNLGSLLELGLSGNQLSGPIPTTIGNLVRVTKIDFNGNKFSRSIPTTIGKLAQIQRLYLYNNKLSGELPSTIGQLTTLNELVISNNQINGAIPTTISKLINFSFSDNPGLCGSPLPAC